MNKFIHIPFVFFLQKQINKALLWKYLHKAIPTDFFHFIEPCSAPIFSIADNALEKREYTIPKPCICCGRHRDNSLYRGSPMHLSRSSLEYTSSSDIQTASYHLQSSSNSQITYSCFLDLLQNRKDHD